MDKKKANKLTSVTGAPVADNQNSLAADPAYGEGVARALGLKVKEAVKA